jgi:uncharacterized protein (TIGR03067 family)
MSGENTSKTGLVSAIIGAVGAIGAAVLPIVFNRPTADPVPAKVDPVPAARAGPAPAAKPAQDPGRKAAARGGGPGGGAVPEKAGRNSKVEQKSPPGELARFHGVWAVEEQTNGDQVLSREVLSRTKPVWQFDGDTVTVLNRGDNPGIRYQGSLTLHPDRSPKNFELTGKNWKGQAFEILGIYTFEGPVLVLRQQLHYATDPGKASRPTSFKIELRPGSGALIRLRRIR